MAKIVATLAFFLGLTATVFAYPNGVPATASVCKQMIPGHGSKPQRSPAPCSVNSFSSTVKGGDQVEVTINSTDAENALKGFYIQARDSQNSPIGSFVPSKNANVHSCGGIRANAAHHVSKEPKESVTLVWKAPASYVGSITFTATCLKDFNTFWTLVQSPTVSVQNPSSSSNATKPSSSASYAKVVISSRKSPVYSRPVVEKEARIMNKKSWVSSKTHKKQYIPIRTTSMATTTVTERIDSTSPSVFSSTTATSTDRHQDQELINAQTVNNYERNFPGYIPGDRLSHQPFPISSPYSFGSSPEGKEYLAAAALLSEKNNLKHPKPGHQRPQVTDDPRVIPAPAFFRERLQNHREHHPPAPPKNPTNSILNLLKSKQPLTPPQFPEYSSWRDSIGVPSEKFTPPKLQHGFRPSFNPFPSPTAINNNNYFYQRETTQGKNGPQYDLDFYRASPSHQQQALPPLRQHKIKFYDNTPVPLPPPPPALPREEFGRQLQTVLLPSFGYLVYNPQRGPPFYIIPTPATGEQFPEKHEDDNDIRSIIKPRSNNRRTSVGPPQQKGLFSSFLSS